jgi:hypothetical protein
MGRLIELEVLCTNARGYGLVQLRDNIYPKESLLRLVSYIFLIAY